MLHICLTPPSWFCKGTFHSSPTVKKGPYTDCERSLGSEEVCLHANYSFSIVPEWQEVQRERARSQALILIFQQFMCVVHTNVFGISP